MLLCPLQVTLQANAASRVPATDKKISTSPTKLLLYNTCIPHCSYSYYWLIAALGRQITSGCFSLIYNVIVCVYIVVFVVYCTTYLYILVSLSYYVCMNHIIILFICTIIRYNRKQP